MQVNPEIAFRNVTRTPAMERAIREGIAELEKWGTGSWPAA